MAIGSLLSNYTWPICALSTAARLHWNQWMLCNPYSVFLLIGLVAGILVCITPNGHQLATSWPHLPHFPPCMQMWPLDVVLRHRFFSFSLIAHFVRLLFFQWPSHLLCASISLAKPRPVCIGHNRFWHGSTTATSLLANKHGSRSVIILDGFAFFGHCIVHTKFTGRSMQNATAHLCNQEPPSSERSITRNYNNGKIALFFSVFQRNSQPFIF